MALARPLSAFSGSSLAMLPITSAPDPSALTPAERALFDALLSERRRNEWWSGRVAGHAALALLGHGDLSILADERGAPILEGSGAEGAHVALAHGRRIAAAVASVRSARFPCVGVDVVDPEDEARVIKIEKRVLTEKERVLVAGDPKISLLAWGAREAIAKATSTGMFAFALKAVSIVGLDRDARRIEVALSVPGTGGPGFQPASGAEVDPEAASFRPPQGAGIDPEAASFRPAQGAGIDPEAASSRPAQGAGIDPESTSFRPPQGAGIDPEAAVEVAFEPLQDGGVLVLAGCSLDFARKARAAAGL